MNDKERQSAADMKEAREKLLECFPGSFINEVDEFIAHPRTNQHFILRDCKTVEAVEAKEILLFCCVRCAADPDDALGYGLWFHLC